MTRIRLAAASLLACLTLTAALCGCSATASNQEQAKQLDQAIGDLVIEHQEFIVKDAPEENRFKVVGQVTVTNPSDKALDNVMVDLVTKDDEGNPYLRSQARLSFVPADSSDTYCVEAFFRSEEHGTTDVTASINPYRGSFCDEQHSGEGFVASEVFSSTEEGVAQFTLTGDKSFYNNRRPENVEYSFVARDESGTLLNATTGYLPISEDWTAQGELALDCAGIPSTFEVTALCVDYADGECTSNATSDDTPTIATVKQAATAPKAPTIAQSEVSVFTAGSGESSFPCVTGWAIIDNPNEETLHYVTGSLTAKDGDGNDVEMEQCCQFVLPGGESTQYFSYPFYENWEKGLTEPSLGLDDENLTWTCDNDHSLEGIHVTKPTTTFVDGNTVITFGVSWDKDRYQDQPLEVQCAVVERDEQGNLVVAETVTGNASLEGQTATFTGESNLIAEQLPTGHTLEVVPTAIVFDECWEA